MEQSLRYQCHPIKVKVGEVANTQVASEVRRARTALHTPIHDVDAPAGWVRVRNLHAPRYMSRFATRRKISGTALNVHDGSGQAAPR